MKINRANGNECNAWLELPHGSLDCIAHACSLYLFELVFSTFVYFCLILVKLWLMLSILTSFFFIDQGIARRLREGNSRPVETTGQRP